MPGDEVVMVHVCAWCDRYLGVKAPGERVVVTHGICRPCMDRQSWEDDPPTLVLSPHRSHLLPVLTELLRGVPEIQVLVDRRTSERREDEGSPRARKERRRPGDRRRNPAMTVV